MAAYARRLLRDLAGEHAPQPQASADNDTEPLTARELEVLALLAGRYSNKEIAAELFITTNTVKRHLLQIFAKLGVNDRRTAVARAWQLGILMDEA